MLAALAALEPQRGLLLGAVPLDLRHVYLASGATGKSLGSYAGAAIDDIVKRGTVPPTGATPGTTTPSATRP